MKIAILIRARGDGQYVASCPALPGCVARASTRESAQRKMREAVLGYVASMDAVVPANVVLAEIRDRDASQAMRGDLVECGNAGGAGWRPTRREREMTR